MVIMIRKIEHETAKNKGVKSYKLILFHIKNSEQARMILTMGGIMKRKRRTTKVLAKGL